MQNKLKIALAGNPNAGKTTLFNTLTGARQTVGNYPGITVEKKSGNLKYNETNVEIVDLPGTYSLSAYSLEEIVARNFIVEEKPDVVVNIVDASNLERNLYLTLQLLELGAPVCIALSMVDIAKNRGIEIDKDLLSKKLNVPVIAIDGRKGTGKDELLKAVLKTAEDSIVKKSELNISYGDDIDNIITKMVGKIEEIDFIKEYPKKWTALKYLENDKELIAKGEKENTKLSQDLKEYTDKVAKHIDATLDSSPEAIIADWRYGFINSIAKLGLIKRKNKIDKLYVSDKIDKVVTNRLLGPILMVAIIFALYVFTFNYSEYPVTLLENFFEFLSNTAETYLPDGLFKSLVISGIIDGVGGVIGFTPIIIFMFFGIAILEDTGYLARVAFMLDRVFKTFGLHGSSVMAYIISGGIAGGCAVPGVMATRTLRSRKERLATLLTAPFMNCGAKLPVMALIVAAFFSNQQAKYMFILTIISWVVALLVAKLLRVTVIRGESTPFVMEMPPYRIPTLRGVLIHTWERTWQYVKKAGTVILAISIIIWAMMTFPSLPQEKIDEFAFEKAQIQKIENQEEAKVKLEEISFKEQEETLKNSVAGRIGAFFEPVSKFAGFNWKTNIALLGGFAAKEVVVSTLGTAYSLGEVDAEDATPLSQKLAKEKDWNKANAFSLLLFMMFYAPCFVAVVCIAKEAGSWKWGAFSIIFNTLFAFTLAVLFYQIASI